MSLPPQFSVSARRTYSSSYDPEDPSAPYLTAALHAFGILALGHLDPLEAQVLHDEIVLGIDSIPEGSGPLGGEAWRHSGLFMPVGFRNLSQGQQCLLVLGFRTQDSRPPTVQLYIGSEWVMSERFDTGGRLALLVDAPANRRSFDLNVTAMLAEEQGRPCSVYFTGCSGYFL